MSKATDIAMVCLTASVIVAVAAAIAAVKTVSEARKMRLEEGRPFVAVEVRNDQFERAGGLSYGALVNSGKRAATNVSARCQLIQSTDQVHWDTLVDSKDSKVTGFGNSNSYMYLLPGHSEPIYCSTDRKFQKQAAMDPNFTVIYGLVTYSGDEGEKYQTPFCITGVGTGTGEDLGLKKAVPTSCNLNEEKTPIAGAPLFR
jgi:hypothetical protein